MRFMKLSLDHHPITGWFVATTVNHGWMEAFAMNCKLIDHWKGGREVKLREILLTSVVDICLMARPQLTKPRETQIISFFPWSHNL